MAFMERIQAVEDIAGKELQHLPKWADSALIGFAEREGDSGREVSACYGYQALKAVLRDEGYTGADAYRMAGTVRYTPGVLLLYKYSRAALWHKVYAEGLHRWEMLDSAVLGIGEQSGKDCAVVYSLPACINVLASVQRWSDEGLSGDTVPTVHALRMIDHTIASVYIGPDTPWLLTPVS